MKSHFQDRIKVGSHGRYIGHKDPCFVVAEAGVNHNGKLSLAKKLVEAAKDAGADAVKFQTFVAKKLVSRALGRKQFEMLRKLELDREAFLELGDYAKQQQMICFSTPFDEESVNVLQEARVPLYKISSGDLDNIPLLKLIARIGKPMIISTGMGTMDEVSDAVDAIAPFCKRLVLTQCTSLYPPRYDEANLRAMLTIKNAFGAPVGYSDHTLGHEVSLAAVALGACLVEKHLTINKKMQGPDHRASLDPFEFGELVSKIRNVEQALGSNEKKPVQRELKMRAYARRSITAVREIAKNTTISEGDISMLRPGDGIASKYIDKVVGKQARVDIRRLQQIKWSMLR
jgi:N-acetylneuraminate synthase/N,N'-diacetyllegionaminate synthase